MVFSRTEAYGTGSSRHLFEESAVNCMAFEINRAAIWVSLRFGVLIHPWTTFFVVNLTFASLGRAVGVLNHSQIGIYCKRARNFEIESVFLKGALQCIKHVIYSPLLVQKLNKD